MNEQTPQHESSNEYALRCEAAAGSLVVNNLTETNTAPLNHLTAERSVQLTGAIVTIPELGQGVISHIDTEAGCALVRLHNTYETVDLNEVWIDTTYLS